MREVLESRVVAILRLRDHGLAVEVAEALVRGGVRVLELTQDDPGALAALRAVAALPDVVVGAGTVLDPATVPALADAGARFIVSPNTDPRVIGAALDAGLEPIPGALTATEVASAIGAGATLVKLFPAGPLGTAYLRALRGPFGHVNFVPTGGIAHDRGGRMARRGRRGRRPRLRPRPRPPDRGRPRGHRGPRPGGGRMIIDAHLHVFRTAALDGREPDALVPAEREATVEQLIALMDAHGVDRAILVGLDDHDEYIASVLTPRFAAIAVGLHELPRRRETLRLRRRAHDDAGRRRRRAALRVRPRSRALDLPHARPAAEPAHAARALPGAEDRPQPPRLLPA